MTQLQKHLFLSLVASFLFILAACEREDPVQPANISTIFVNYISSNSAQSGGNITDDGGKTVTARGVVYSTNETPTVETNEGITTDGTGRGEFTSSLKGLNAETTYYIRAYATNSEGTAYGEQENFTTLADSGENGTTKIVEVTNPKTGRTWMDRNLGANRAATSSSDEEAYGDLYQWGRTADGHEKRNSNTTSTISSSDTPGHGDFITGDSDSDFDWRSPQNNNLWQGVNGTNNPCPDGYRLPTEEEWEAERKSWNSNDEDGAFSSPLKLPVAGYRLGGNDSFYGVGSSGYYWSSTVDLDMRIYSRCLRFRSGNAGTARDYRKAGYSVRCIKD